MSPHSGQNFGGFVGSSGSQPHLSHLYSGAPVGFAERVQNYHFYDMTEDGTLVVPNGAAVELAVKGDFFIQADATTSAGATVYADTSNGAATLTSGASTVDTGFKTWNATTSGEMAIITKR